MKLLLNPAYQELESLLSDLPNAFEKEGKVLYKARNELRILDCPNFQLNVKRYRKPIFANRVIYTFFRKSKARRAYEYAMILQKKGFGTPEPLAYMELKSRGLLSDSYFVSKHIAEFRMMREFADGSDIVGREDIVEAFGVFAARLHEAGVLHLDLSIGNILFRKDADGIHFWLVDLNRMRFCTIGKDLGCKNFERLRGSRAFFELLAKTYADERGFDSTDCLFKILGYQQQSAHDFRSRSIRKQKMKGLTSKFRFGR